MATPPDPSRPCLLSNRVTIAAESGDVAVAAAGYAAGGYPVFPLHTPDAAGRCSCRRDCGRDVGKHPRTINGLSGATTDPVRVRGWWTTWPDANIGLATGAVAGLVILDVDSRTGEASAEALEAEYGAVPETWTAETGGGLHLYFRHPGGRVPTRAGKLGPGLDVRADGGYAIAPPSLHRSGRRYRWAADWHPRRVALAAVPPWLVALMTSGTGERIAPANACPVLGRDRSNDLAYQTAAIPEGQRNATLASLAGTMRRRGFGEAAIAAALVAENAARCRPPLPETEVEKIARSVARYAPAAPPVRPTWRGLRVREVRRA